MTTSIHIDLGARSYDLAIGEDLLESAGERLAGEFPGRRIFILSDANVAAHYEKPLTESLRQAGFSEIQSLVLPPGEQTKSFTVLEQVLSWLLENRIDRKSLVIALGGGVIGDLAGFAASIVLRGVDYVQIPTSLLAQIDSSIGGKTAIDTPHGKNLVGSFHQPVAVLADTGTLATLPERELLAGYAEGVKHAVLADRDFYGWIEQHSKSVLALEAGAIERFVDRNCRIKADVVQADEKEQGRRAHLNFGHTFAHALEAACSYDGRLLHGEAVAIGMIMAMELSVKKGLCPERDARQLKNHLKQAGLPVTVHDVDPVFCIGPEELYGLMQGDKKSAGGKVHYILSRGIGDVVVSADVDRQDILSVLEESFKG